MPSTRKSFQHPTLEQAVGQFLRRVAQCSRDNLGYVQSLPACYVADLQEVFDKGAKQHAQAPTCKLVRCPDCLGQVVEGSKYHCES